VIREHYEANTYSIHTMNLFIDSSENQLVKETQFVYWYYCRHGTHRHGMACSNPNGITINFFLLLLLCCFVVRGINMEGTLFI
jgi:hypothetical protein